MTKREFCEKLKSARVKAGLTQTEVATLIGRPQQTIGGWETGRSQPDINTLEQLLLIYGCPPNSFFDYTNKNVSPVFSSEEQEHIIKYRVLDVHGKRAVDGVLNVEYDRMTHVVEQEQRGSITYINCYDLAVSAGLGEPWSGDAGYKTRIELPTQQIPENAHYCVRVNGRSMEPAYYDGDIVFVQRLDEMVRIGEIGIFFLNGDGYIKRLGHGVLESLNPKYAPISLHDYDELRCQGRVLGKI